MECESCGKTHRELPEGIVPYKRMDAEQLSSIAEAKEEKDLGDTEASTWKRVREWVMWFLEYALNVLKSLQTIHGKEFPAKYSGDRHGRQLTYYVRLVANSGNWIQHRSAMQVGS